MFLLSSPHLVYWAQLRGSLHWLFNKRKIRMDEQEKRVARNIIVVGSGGATIAGLTTTVLGVTAAVFSFSVAPAVGALIGLGGFAVGAVSSYLYRDELVKKAEKIAARIDEPDLT